MSKDTGGPAFPSTPDAEFAGMELRDYFAIKALQAILGNSRTLDSLVAITADPSGAAAAAAYQWADVMLRERIK